MASDDTTPAPHGAQPRSLHERVMSEQRQREVEAAAAAALTTTTSAAPLQSAAADSAAADAPAADARPDGPTALVLTQGQTPLEGTWNGTADRLASYLLAICPAPSFSVSVQVLAEYYVRYAAEAGLRADLLWAQMIHETGYGMYGGCVVPQQNNYAGIGATGGGEPGLSFSTAEAGVLAHVAHMVAYVYESSPVEWANASTDPRFDYVNPRGVATVLADLDGRWAVPGTTYGERIEDIVRAINTY